MGAAGPAMGLQAVGGITSAYGAYQQGLAQQNYYDYLASNNRTEAGMALKQGEQESGFAQAEGAFQSKQLTRKTAEITGSQTAEAGANGTAGSVTAADISADTFDKAKLDQMAIKYNADVQSWKAENDARMKAYSLNRQADEYMVAGKAAKSAGKIGAINSLLGSAGQTANTAFQASKY